MRNTDRNNTDKNNADQNNADKKPWAGAVPRDVSAVKAQLERLFDGASDFIMKELTVLSRKTLITGIDGLIDGKLIAELAIKPLLLAPNEALGIADLRDGFTLDDVAKKVLFSCETMVENHIEIAFDKMMHGDALIFMDGMDGVIVMNARGWEHRSIAEPQTEITIRGPREGFTENLRTNTMLIRRRLATADLRFEPMQIGRRSNCDVCVAYLASIANDDIVKEVRKRLATIDVDLVNGSGTIAECIKDQPYSLYDTISYTEKPDIVAAQLMEGRVAIMVDGTPFVLTAPMLFIENFQTAEDYVINPFYASFLRVLRICAFLICTFAPAVYVSLTTFHQELIPQTLLFTFVASAEGLPFSSFIETTLMLVVFEILKEAGIRLPKPVGQAVSIVGALVMGQAAIMAGIVGAPVVIIVAMTGVASFAVPMLSNASTLMRWLMLALSAMLGGYGLTIGLLMSLIHLGGLMSFGVPYLTPLAPFVPADMKDIAVRLPIWKLVNRPVALKPKDLKRVNFGRKDWV